MTKLEFGPVPVTGQVVAILIQTEYGTTYIVGDDGRILAQFRREDVEALGMAWTYRNDDPDEEFWPRIESVMHRLEALLP